MNHIEKKISSEEIYNGRILRLHVDKVELPNGKTSIRECVDHKNAVAVLARRDDCFVFVRQCRYAVGKILLEIPAGLLEENEDPKDAAIRELQEEVGLKPQNLHFFGKMMPSPGFTDETTSLFFSDSFEEHALTPDDDEFIQVVLIPVDTAYMLYSHGFFEDAKTACALGYYFSM